MKNKKKFMILMFVMLFTIGTLFGCANQSQTESSQNQEQTKAPEKESSTPTEDQTAKDNGEQEDNILIESPLPDASVKIGMSFQLSGKARIDAKELQYEFEDGHNILSKGKIPLTGAKDAGGWVQFTHTVKLEENPSSPFGTLIIYALKADGTKDDQLMVTYNFDPKVVKP